MNMLEEQNRGENMKKGKLTMIISIGCTALILTMIIFTQFKTVEETDITAIETMRETELREELADLKAKYEEIDEKISETENKINEYKTELANNADSSQLLQNEIAEAEDYLGYTPLVGEGIEVILSDGNDIIQYYDLLKLVNNLNEAGAEAISINDERIINTSAISLVGTRIILVNEKKISGPYFVKAIGNQKYLESAITIKGGYKDLLEEEGKNIEYNLKDSVLIPAYDGEDILLKHAKINEDKEE